MLSRQWRGAVLGTTSILLCTPASGQILGGINELLDQASAFSSVASHESDDRLGEALTAGDFNGDGWDDLAIGSPGEDVEAIGDAGTVFVLYGGWDGLEQRAGSLDGNAAEAFDQDEIEAAGGLYCGGAENGDRFGEVLTAGDFDGDGFADLAIGVPHERDPTGSFAETGLVVVLYGSVQGLRSAGGQLTFQLWDEDRTVITDKDEYGGALATGDFNDDGAADLAVGAPGEYFTDTKVPFRAGTVTILYGVLGVGLTETGRQKFFETPLDGFGGPESRDKFGAALAAGDLEGDGDDDLVIGVPGEDVVDPVTHGAVQIARGGAAGLALPDESVRIGAVTDDLLLALAVADLDDDGREDLAAGIPNFDSNQSQSVLTYKSSPPPGTPYGSFAGGLFTISQELGFSVAVGDVMQYGIDTMIGGEPGSNHVWLYQWVPDDFPYTYSMSQDSPAMVDTVEVGDRFGSALAVGEFGLGEGLDLAIGVPYEDTGLTTNGGAVHAIYNQILLRNGFEPGEVDEWISTSPLAPVPSRLD